MSDTVLKIENLSKQYHLGEIGTGTLSHDLHRWWAQIRGKENPYSIIGQVDEHSNKNELDDIWALKDVNLSIKRGEILGIIGKNGAGKSTLLKLVSRITSPTTGSIKVNGRIASLLEVGTGMHPEMTARENIYLNGMILGMKHHEISYKFNEIVSFAGIEKFIDTPIKRYSSGMHVRLGFAVAAFLEPEILIVDEVLAVGDAEFQRKCLGKMESVSREEGRTILFVSHNLKAVGSLCNRGVLLDEGNLIADGETSDVISTYEDMFKSSIDDGLTHFSFPSDPTKDGQITKISILKSITEPSIRFGLLDPINIELEFVLRREFSNLMFCLHIWGSDNTFVLASTDSDHTNFLSNTMNDLFPRKMGSYKASIKIPAPLLNAGVYELEFLLTPGPQRLDTQRGIFIEVVDNGSYLTYARKSNRGGILSTPLQWDVGYLKDMQKLQSIRQ